MKKILNRLANKALSAAFVVLGAATAGAEELNKTPIIQSFDGVEESVGYTVTGLGDFKNEVAVVFTNHTKTATWTVPETLENVQFLVVGGGGGGGAGTWGPGGGGGGVVTGYVYQLKKNVAVDITVGAGGSGGTSNGAKGKVGGNSSIIVGETTYVLAYGGGAGRNKANGVSGGSGSGGGADSNNTTTYVGGGVTEALCNEEVIFAEPFGHKGGTNGKRAYASGGGGGAMGDGGDGSGQTGGAGGAGLKMDITGSLITYGSGGGGGGSAKKGSGGTNAGNGGYSTNAATPAVANRGGGGGGGGNKKIAGSAGGSGIVVFRYALPTGVAKIGDTEYASLDAAIQAAGTQDEVVLVADVATDAAFEIAKKVTIDLNGKTIATTEKDTEGNGVFWVKSGGELTLNGEGTINGVGGNKWNIGIFAENGGKVIINGGTYTNEGAQDAGPDGNHFDLIYVKNGGSVEINGGTFKCETPNWTLNSHDTAKGTIVVKGGTFYQFNPKNCATEGAGTNFCADGYVAELNNEGYYVVAKLAIAPDGTTEVTAETPEEAAGKVVILVPEAMKDAVTADEYAKYFVKTAEYNETTGKYTVTAALNPEVVKPVIAETTADDATKEAFVIDADGNVTLNINNKKPGLYYGVQVLAELGADPVAVVPETNGSLLVPAENLPEGNAAFFKVVVDFAPIVVPEAE